MALNFSKIEYQNFYKTEYKNIQCIWIYGETYYLEKKTLMCSQFFELTTRKIEYQKNIHVVNSLN